MVGEGDRLQGIRPHQICMFICSFALRNTFKAYKFQIRVGIQSENISVTWPTGIKMRYERRCWRRTEATELNVIYTWQDSFLAVLSLSLIVVEPFRNCLQIIHDLHERMWLQNLCFCRFRHSNFIPQKHLDYIEMNGDWKSHFFRLDARSNWRLYSLFLRLPSARPNFNSSHFHFSFTNIHVRILVLFFFSPSIPLRIFYSFFVGCPHIVAFGLCVCRIVYWIFYFRACTTRWT